MHKLLICVTLTATIFASFLVLCTRTNMMNSMNDDMQSIQHAMVGTAMIDCMQNTPSCLMSLAGHMNLFAHLYPLALQDLLNLLLFLTISVFLVYVSLARIFLLNNERLRTKIRNLLLSLAHSLRPLLFVLTFSRGILHSKIYA